jgi:hypothetical protein
MANREQRSNKEPKKKPKAGKKKGAAQAGPAVSAAAKPKGAEGRK